MFFSEQFKVDAEVVKSYGAVDISLVCDIPLFIDPMLIFNSDKPEYQALHEDIIKYFHFLHSKTRNGLSTKEINAWFNFSEIPNNWFGYSMSGNKGLALGEKYAKFLYLNIGFALNTSGISKGQHIEKVMLLYEGSGKDKISDLAVNLIKKYLCEYTQEFAKSYIDPMLCKMMPVEKAFFNYSTESFVSKEYFLPFIINEKGKVEYVLLTPYDILREDEPAINKIDFFKSHERIRASIENEELRAYINNYVVQAVNRYEESQKNNHLPISDRSRDRIEKNAFREMVKEFPELYDYYVRLREADTEELKIQCAKELNEQLDKLLASPKKLIALFKKSGYIADKGKSAREEARERISYFKHIIEDCDGYRCLYHNGTQIANEGDLQRLFKFVWRDTGFKLDAEPNNGRGRADFILSMGQDDQSIIEFKLAANSTLDHVFKQVKIYEAANCSEGSIIVIFFFSEKERIVAKQMVTDAGCESLINESIYLIDCRNDNKPSASVV